jgi:tight adherence protein C
VIVELLNPEYLIPAAVFLGIVLMSLALILFFRFLGERRKVVSKIKTSTSPGMSPRSMSSGEMPVGSQKSAIGRFFTAVFFPIGKKVAPKSEQETSALRKSFLQAGYRGEYLIPVYFGAKIVGTALMVGGYFLLNRYLLKQTEINYIVGGTILTALVGYSLPTFWLSLRTRHRKEKIFEGLPDALDLMVVLVEAGLGLDAAIHRVSEEIALDNKVVSDEFKQVGLELRAGMMRRDALRNLAMRCDHEDVSSLVALLIQTDKFGTSVAQALRVHADAMRTKRFQRAEEMAAKIPVKLTFPLILFIFPSLFVVIVGPAAISIYRNLFSRM